MTTTGQGFTCEVLNADERQNTRVVCHGRLVAGDTEGLREAVRPLIERGGRVIVDCADLSYVDSMGLGAMVALKVSAIHKGYVTLEFEHLTPRIAELLRITKLTDYLTKPGAAQQGS